MHILFSGRVHLFTSEYFFTEFEKYKEEILRKTKRTTEDFFRLLEILKRRITLIPLEELTRYVEEAEVSTPDPKDMAYFALALKLNCAIWSNDKKLKEQDNKNSQGIAMCILMVECFCAPPIYRRIFGISNFVKI